MTARVSSLGPDGVRRLLAGREGLRLRTGPFVNQIRTRLPDVARALTTLYADHPLAGNADFVDFSVGIQRPLGWRMGWKRQAVFQLEDQVPFHPLAGDQGFPMLEWGLNWCVYAHCHQYLILHAAVLERGGRALIMPAPSGSGKSTLCAALAFHGWRLLSDELALIDPADGMLVPLPRPISLKNASIEVMARLLPGLSFGSRVTETAKGEVAHVPAPADAVQRADVRALPGWVVLPRYIAGRQATLAPLAPAQGFMSLIENAFNYDVFGPEGFTLLGAVIDRCPCFTFEYGDLPQAIAQFNRLAEGDPLTPA
jgi:HprK-related kinase A